MANNQGLAIIAVLVTLGSKASIAMPPRDIPAEVKSCKAISTIRTGLNASMVYSEDLRRHQNHQTNSKRNSLQKKSRQTGQ